MSKNAVQNAQIGNFLEIIANTNEHDFKIGQVVVAVDWQDFDSEDADNGVECAPIEGGEHWFVKHTDYQITAHHSEYARLRQQLAEEQIKNKRLRDALSTAHHRAIDERWDEVARILRQALHQSQES